MLSSPGTMLSQKSSYISVRMLKINWESAPPSIDGRQIRAFELRSDLLEELNVAFLELFSSMVEIFELLALQEGSE